MDWEARLIKDIQIEERISRRERISFRNSAAELMTPLKKYHVIFFSATIAFLSFASLEPRNFPQEYVSNRVI